MSLENNNHFQQEELIHGVAQLLHDYVKKSSEGKEKVLQQLPPREIATALNAAQILKKGLQDNAAALDFISNYLSHTNHLKNPRYLGHQVAVPHDLSGIPDWIHGTINNPSSLYEMGPAGATLEGVVINWMLQKLGWFGGEDAYDFRLRDGAGSGFLTHGGSVANLTALAAARAFAAPQAWNEGNPQNLVVIGPESSHYSIGRAAAKAVRFATEPPWVKKPLPAPSRNRKS
jgi:L-2,4-diaminobutyrate decarboxylase